MRLIFNWKQGFENDLSGEKTLKILEKYTKIDNKKEIVVCPNFLKMDLVKNTLDNFKNNLKKDNFSIALQDFAPIYSKKSTGELELEMLKIYEPKYALIGHSETRLNKKLDENDILNRLIACKKSGIIPIVCVGFVYPEMTEIKSIKIQIKTVKKWIKQEEKIDIQKDLMIAYEPVLAIGTGILPNLMDILKIIKLIKKEINGVQICYGGSVNPQNIKELEKALGVETFLVGSACLNENVSDF